MRPNPGQGECPATGRQAFLLTAAVCALLPGQAQAAIPDMLNLSSPDGAVVLSGLACGGVALAIAAGLWALAEQRATRRLRKALRGLNAKSKAALGAREALLGAGREALVVWGRDGTSRSSHGGGEDQLQSCLKGPDADALSAAIDTLSARGTGFQMPVQDAQGRQRLVRGRAVGAMAALWIDTPETAVQAGPDYRAILDALPLPVWLRGKDMALTWANRAYLKSVGAADLEAARLEQAVLDPHERDLAAAAQSRNATQESRRFSVVGGQRRALDLAAIPLADMGVVGVGQDVTVAAVAEARLQQQTDAHAATLDVLQTAVAIFGPDQKLVFHNKAFAALWGLPGELLNRHPGDGEILDWLREARRLPEQRDYQAWKRGRLALYQAGARVSEENWHLPGGQTIRVTAQPHPLGGLTFLYEDVSARITLESNYNTLMKVQSATLDTLSEGVAVFGPDGKLKLHNAAFARIWAFGAQDLEGEPHLRAIASLSRDKFGDNPIWDQAIGAVVAGSRAQELGEIERSDRSILSVGTAPLPDGATLVTFADVTNRARVESALRHRAQGLEEADRLKSDFVRHMSYELRTPLHAILDYSEQLASEPLTEQQRDRVNAIAASGTTLKNLVNDILDLAQIDSGVMRLEMQHIDLTALINEIAGHAREWAGKMGLTLTADVPFDAGSFLADGRRLRQVIYNLLSNAFKFTPRGGTIALSARIAGDDVQITVADTGPGLPPDMKATVFERFSTSGEPGQRAGAGLGLALVNRFLDLHDGWVEIESREGGGTLVRCHLPRRTQENGLEPPRGQQMAYR